MVLHALASSSRPSSRTAASGRSAHFSIGLGDDGSLAHRRVLHDRVLQLDRGNPLATRLDQVLGAVGEVDMPRRSIVPMSPVRSQPPSTNLSALSSSGAPK